MRVERRVITIERRAIGTDDLAVIAHVAENMRMIHRRPGAHAHEFLGTDLDNRNAGIIVEVRNNVIGHDETFKSCPLRGGDGPHHSDQVA